MANKKRRCTLCKKYKVAVDGIICPVGFFCDKKCRYDYATNKTAFLISKSKEIETNKKNKIIRDRKRQFKLNDVKLRKKAAKKACHDYIRYRDRLSPCICCGRTLGDNFHAGHWLESGNNPKIRFDEDNIHGQRVDCNLFKGGDSGDYEKNLRKKIGDERVDCLLDKKGGKSNLTAEDYLSIEKKYKLKNKEINMD